jgi:hypothetical protein
MALLDPQYSTVSGRDWTKLDISFRDSDSNRCSWPWLTSAYVATKVPLSGLETDSTELLIVEQSVALLRSTEWPYDKGPKRPLQLSTQRRNSGLMSPLAR